jgi:hypothetical protein
MAAGDVAHDGKSETGAGFILVARRIKTVERPEHILACVGRDARTVIVDIDGEPPAAVDGLDGDLVGMSAGVGDQIGQQAVKCVGRTLISSSPCTDTFTVAPRRRPSAATFSTTLFRLTVPTSSSASPRAKER